MEGKLIHVLYPRVCPATGRQSKIRSDNVLY